MQIVKLQLSYSSVLGVFFPKYTICKLVILYFEEADTVTKMMELVNHKVRTMLLSPLYSPAHLDIRSGNRGFSP